MRAIRISRNQALPCRRYAGGYIKSLKGPFGDTDYVAIGGVNRDNAADFIRQGYIGVSLGSNVLPKDAVQAKDWASASAYAAGLLADIKNGK